MALQMPCAQMRLRCAHSNRCSVQAQPVTHRERTVRCSAETDHASRRHILQLGGFAAASVLFPNAALAKGPKGFNPVKDNLDGYSFVYPFGWQEVTVQGQDVVYKDIIEPLESVSVSITLTDKTDVSEFGDPSEVALALADKVLTSPSQEVKLLNVEPKSVDGRNYIEFEFAAKSSNYVRHAIAVVTVGNGKFYTLTTGANERRWNKLKEKLTEIVKSFEVTNRYDG